MIASSWLDFGLPGDLVQVTTVAFRLVIALVLTVSITASLRKPLEHDTIELVPEPEDLPPPSER